MSLYRIKDLTHCYSTLPVLSIDRLDIGARQIVGLIGPNGSGKSTLLKLLAFIEKPTQGRILFNGRPAVPFDSGVRFKVALLPQEPYLMKRCVADNIAYGLKIRGTAGADIDTRVAAVLDMVGLPRGFAKRQWFELSGGEAQRVALAARLVLEPEVLLLDEPTASVDAASAPLIRAAALAARRQWGTSLIIASHDWPWLYGVCDEVRHLYGGRLIGAAGGSLVFGPWVAAGDGLAIRTFEDGQRFIAANAPAHLDGAVVALGADRLSVHDRQVAAADDCCVLAAELSRLENEKGADTVRAIFQLGDSRLAARLPADQVLAMKLIPGRPFFLSYDPGRLTWY